MQIVAKVTISNSNFENWSVFFDSYKDKRSEFVQNETIEKISDNEARITFEITDLEGLTHLSSSEEITSREVELGVVTEILYFFGMLGIFRAFKWREVNHDIVADYTSSSFCICCICYGAFFCHK